VDLVDSDIVLAVASSGYVRHGERKISVWHEGAMDEEQQRYIVSRGLISIRRCLTWAITEDGRKSWLE
jgi:hypothetical protein